MYKLKGIVKVCDDGDFSITDGFRKLLAKNGLNPYGGSEGYYKGSFSIKRGKRRKLKKLKIHFYNKYPCDCCGPYWVAEVV